MNTIQQIWRGLITFAIGIFILFLIVCGIFFIIDTLAEGPNWARILIGIIFLCLVGVEYGNDSHKSGWWPW